MLLSLFLKENFSLIGVWWFQKFPPRYKWEEASPLCFSAFYFNVFNFQSEMAALKSVIWDCIGYNSQLYLFFLKTCTAIVLLVFT